MKSTIPNTPLGAPSLHGRQNWSTGTAHEADGGPALRASTRPRNPAKLIGIGVEPRHAESRLIVGPSPSLDFRPVASHIVPGIGQILRRHRRVRAQDIGVRHARLPHAMQNPHGNARSDDAGLATANPIARLDARKSIAQILHHMLQHAGLLGTRQLSQKLLHLLQRTHSSILPPSRAKTNAPLPSWPWRASRPIQGCSFTGSKPHGHPPRPLSLTYVTYALQFLG